MDYRPWLSQFHHPKIFQPKKKMAVNKDLTDCVIPLWQWQIMQYIFFKTTEEVILEYN